MSSGDHQQCSDCCIVTHNLTLNLFFFSLFSFLFSLFSFVFLLFQKVSLDANNMADFQAYQLSRCVVVLYSQNLRKSTLLTYLHVFMDTRLFFTLSLSSPFVCSYFYLTPHQLVFFFFFPNRQCLELVAEGALLYDPAEPRGCLVRL